MYTALRMYVQRRRLRWLGAGHPSPAKKDFGARSAACGNPVRGANQPPLEFVHRAAGSCLLRSHSQLLGVNRVRTPSSRAPQDRGLGVHSGVAGAIRRAKPSKSPRKKNFLPFILGEKTLPAAAGDMAADAARTRAKVFSAVEGQLGARVVACEPPGLHLPCVLAHGHGARAR